MLNDEPEVKKNFLEREPDQKFLMVAFDPFARFQNDFF
jgi:hypothetical protein